MLRSRAYLLGASAATAMQGPPASQRDADAWAAWIAEEVIAIAAEHGQDVRDDAMQGVVDHFVASQPR